MTLFLRDLIKGTLKSQVLSPTLIKRDALFQFLAPDAS
jgi:hypothetical protein